jgi:hypothetical protein
VRQVNGVDEGITLKVGSGLGVGEAIGGVEVKMVIGWFDGEQAVIVTRSASSSAICFVA